MRTIVDLPEDAVKNLDALGKKQDLSRAELVRRAVAAYLEEEQEKASATLDKYFGMFKNEPDVFDGLDGMAWQEKMRAEWDDREADIENRRDAYAGLNDQSQAEIGTPKIYQKPDKD